jgi:hypothetical protein
MNQKIYKCVRPGCPYFTKEPFNYCPLCGSVLVVHDGKSEPFPVIFYTEPKSPCRMAYQCATMELYSAECDKLKVRHQCIVGLWGMMESLEAQMRTLRVAFEDFGIRVPPQKPSDLEGRPGQERRKDVR